MCGVPQGKAYKERAKENSQWQMTLPSDITEPKFYDNLDSIDDFKARSQDVNKQDSKRQHKKTKSKRAMKLTVTSGLGIAKEHSSPRHVEHRVRYISYVPSQHTSQPLSKDFLEFTHHSH